MTPYLIVGAAGALLTYFVFTPLVLAVVTRAGIYAVPRDRKVHRTPLPTLGGVAIYLGFVAALAISAWLPQLGGTFRFSETFGLVLGGLVVLALGIADDRYELSPPAKLAGQILAGGIVYLSGVQMSFFYFPGVGVISLSADLSAVVTIVWIVLLTNAVNYVDGLAGLAAGLTAISAAALYFYSTGLPPEYLGPAPLAPLVAIALAGVCLGFLPFNFDPQRINLGDTGAMPLGFFLATASVSLIGRFNGPGAAGGTAAMPLIFTPIVFLAIPLSDFSLVTLVRLARRRPIMKADHEHIHYRLLRFGHSTRQTVLVMYGWALLSAAGLVVAGRIPTGRFILAFAIAAVTVLVLTLAPLLRGPRRRRPVATPATPAV